MVSYKKTGNFNNFKKNLHGKFFVWNRTYARGKIDIIPSGYYDNKN